MSQIVCSKCGASDYWDYGQDDASGNSLQLTTITCRKCGTTAKVTKGDVSRYQDDVFGQALAKVIGGAQRKGGGDFLTGLAVEQLEKLESEMATWSTASDTTIDTANGKLVDLEYGDSPLPPKYQERLYQLRAELDVKLRERLLKTIEEYESRTRDLGNLSDFEKRAIQRELKALVDRREGLLDSANRNRLQELIAKVRASITPRWWEFWLKKKAVQDRGSVRANPSAEPEMTSTSGTAPSSKPNNCALSEDSIRWNCNSFGKRLSALTKLAGNKCKCPNCKNEQIVPNQSDSRPAKQSESQPYIKWKCPSCGQSLQALEKLVGRQATCPKCKHRHSVVNA